MTQKFTDEEFRELYDQKLNDYQIAKRLGVNPHAVFQRRKKLGLPTVRALKPEKKMTKELSYLIGVAFGDVNMGEYECDERKKYSFELASKDKEFVEKFRNCFKSVFEYELPLRHFFVKGYDHPYWKAGAQRKAVYEFMGNFVKESVVRGTKKAFKLEVLRGLFDSEGSINASSKGLLLRLGCKKGNNLIGYLLDHFDISYGIHPNKSGFLEHHLWSGRAKKLHNLFEGFTIQRKERKFQDFVNSYEKEPWSKEEDEFLRKKWKEPLTCEEMGKLLGNRTGIAVRARAERLGLKRDPKVKSQIYSRSHRLKRLDKSIPKMKELRKKGVSYKKIGEKLGCDGMTVYNRLN